MLTLRYSRTLRKIYLFYMIISMKTHTVYLSLGSNLNQPQKQVLRAIERLKEHPDISSLKASSLYETVAIGPKQPNFINAALKIETHLSPHELLDLTQSIEMLHQRQRTLHWGPRTLDIDIILFDTLMLNDERLTIPHKEMKNRGFVLIPLAEIEPNLTLPTGERIESLLTEIDHLDEIKKIEKEPLL